MRFEGFVVRLVANDGAQRRWKEESRGRSGNRRDGGWLCFLGGTSGSEKLWGKKKKIEFGILLKH